MGSKPKTPEPPPPPPPAPVSRTMDAEATGDSAILKAKRRSAYAKSFLTGPQQTLGGSQGGTGSFLGGM